MNAEPLPLEHGLPARLVVPGFCGYVSATKWLTRLELTTAGSVAGFWVGARSEASPAQGVRLSWPERCLATASAIWLIRNR
jgi:DMSO/TMAO reductase YedYZ molybdopterin-dependent catalytic subunit